MKRIIPAVASTNAVIAGIVKILTNKEKTLIQITSFLRERIVITVILCARCFNMYVVRWLISLRLLFFTAACATEVFKIATRLVVKTSFLFRKGIKCFVTLQFFLSSAYIPLNNYLVFNDVDGLYTHAFEAERKVSLIF